MRVSDIMTKNPQCCTRETTIQEAARMMLEEDCGSLPICESQDNRQVVGMVTDRDIAIRAVAAGKDGTSTVGEIMSHPVAVIQTDASLDDAVRCMADNQVRRIPVVENNVLVGIVAQADVARTGQDEETAHLVEKVSDDSL